MVGHDYEFVQTEFALRAVLVESFQKQACGSIGLQSVSLVPSARGHEERARSGDYVPWIGIAFWDGHRQRLKPIDSGPDAGTAEATP